MKALEILNSISVKMTKTQILAAVGQATAELNLMDIHQVAKLLGGKTANIRARAINNGLGTRVGKMGRVYSPADVVALRVLIKGGHKPKTLALKEEMVRLKAIGLTNRAIATKLGVDPSYVTLLLR